VKLDDPTRTAPEDRTGSLARDYEPIHPRGLDWRRYLRALWAPFAAIVGLAVKFGFVLVKFAGLFISVGAYALIGGWAWGIGLVLLILVHELGHAAEARRQGLQVSAPTFIPFFGAYVTIRHAGLTPWRSALVALAGPFAGGIAAAACWVVGQTQDSHLFTTIAYTGFILNLFNLIPVGFLDGGAVARAIGEAWRMPVIHFEGGVPMRALGPDRRRAAAIAFLYGALALLLVYGMARSHVPQHRL
jgi:Zn-dependent protease